MRVEVRDNHVDQALHARKRKLQREGIMREMRERIFYKRPPVKAKERAQRSLKLLRKAMATRLEREGH